MCHSLSVVQSCWDGAPGGLGGGRAGGGGGGGGGHHNIPKDCQVAIAGTKKLNKQDSNSTNVHSQEVPRETAQKELCLF